jgi:hypothetical protein
MKRLPFRLPEWPPRITWSSPRAREVWDPRISSVSTAWLKVERDSVIQGIRAGALQHVTPENLPTLIQELAPHGLIALPLGKSPRADGYQSASRALNDGEPWDYRVAITRPQHAAEWSRAWAANDDDTIGALLGTPECCRRFFERVWKTKRWIDTTIPMCRDLSEKSTQTSDNAHGIANIPPGVNMLWRWLGVRPVSHLPCSFQCVESLALAHKCRQILPETERAWMDEILSWPVRYTSLHGIAEITSPIHRMSVPTDALAERHEIRYLGTGYPAEGAQGVDFPHILRGNTAPADTAKPVPLRLTRAQDPGDNGFTSRVAQDAAHRRLLDALSPGPFGTVLDLGCGDGTLLSKIPAARRVGVEIDPARARHARTLDRVIEGDCTDATLVQRVLNEEHPDLIIAQAARNPPESLPGHVVLSYSYETGAAPPALVRTHGTDVRRE